MSETTEQATELVDRAEIVNGEALVKYSKTEAQLAAMRQRFANVVFDLTTTKGDKEARAARLELVTLRTSLEKQRKAFKEPALTLGRKIDAEAARITGEIKALETPIDDQINADENRRAAEKAERERIEAERVAAHQAKLVAMRGCVARAHGLPSARIANGIAQVEAIVLGVTAWEEFAAEAATAKQETLAAMRTMFDSAKAREDEEARVEAQRQENERIAAENRVQAERLAEQQRVLEAKAAAIRAEQDAIEARRVEEVAKVQCEAEAKRSTGEAIKNAAAPAVESPAAPAVSADPAPAVSITAIPAAGVQITTAAPVAARVSPALPTESGARLTLGQINERLAPISITVAGLSELGFDPVEQIKSSRMYRESDLGAMCEALIQHLTTVADGVVA